MKLLAPLVLLAASSATARSSFFGSQEALIKDDLPPVVPGQNPLSYCASPDDYLLNVTSVDLDPNPPKAGTSLKISGLGSLKEDIEDGATVQLQVKYGLIRLINQEVQLCDYADQVDLSCPLKKGDVKISKSVDLPNEIPPGKYTVMADVLTKDKSKTITCVQAVVVFSR